MCWKNVVQFLAGEIFLFTTTSRPPMEPTQLLAQRGPGLLLDNKTAGTWREAKHFPSPSAGGKHFQTSSKC